MTNEELKEKICDIIAPYVSAYGDDERIAEALIAAGIGDVKEAEMERKAYEVAASQYRIEFETQKYWREVAEHRAEVAERALGSACQDIISTMEFICEAGGVVTVENYSPEKATPQAYLKRAERELAEERKDEQS